MFCFFSDGEFILFLESSQNNLLNYTFVFCFFSDEEFRMVLESSNVEEGDFGASDDGAGAAGPPG